MPILPLRLRCSVVLLVLGAIGSCSDPSTDPEGIGQEDALAAVLDTVSGEQDVGDVGGPEDAGDTTFTHVVSCTGVADGTACKFPLACVEDAICEASSCVPADPDAPRPTGACEELSCEGGVLVLHPRAAGESCEGANFCNESAACDGAGSCVGTPTQIAIDCEAVDDALAKLVAEGKTTASCVKSVICNPTNGRCEANGWAGAGTRCERAFVVDAAGIPKTPVTDINLCYTGSCGVSVAGDDPPGVTECTAGPPVVCPPLNGGCKTGTCEPESGQCIDYQPIAVGEKCSDENACTTQDRCDIKGFCVGTPFDDGLPPGDCGKKTCSTIAGKPAYGLVNENKACTPADPCLLTGTCDKGVCEAGPKTCEDFDPCTEDTCEPGVGCHFAKVEGGTGGVEVLCDGVDDDCDGTTDEDFTTETPDGHSVTGIGQPCGVGVCANGATLCDAGGVRCSTSDKIAPEDCNGVDDDCDGLTDADDPSLAPEPCEKTVGVCEGATKADALCQSGGWVPCAAPDYGDAYAELEESTCDALDNDCDGDTDEPFSHVSADGVVTALGETCGGGICAGGVTVCSPDQSKAICSTLGSESVEVCDQIDNDCDGLTDAEDSSLSLPGCELTGGVCGFRLKPKTACSLGQWRACGADEYGAEWEVNVEHTCDAQDNDCDGHTDEDFTYLNSDGTTVGGVGASCGVGACASGTTVCADGGAAIVCSSAGQAGAETCNGKDDDCDGKADADDDGLIAVPCELGQGICAGKMKPSYLCSPLGWLECGEAEYGSGWQPDGELACDGLDNDCDGPLDEDFTTTTADGVQLSGIGVACGTGLCGGGVTACGADGSSTVCSTSSKAGSELCNGKDDDCDGLVDALDPDLALELCELQEGVCGGAKKTAAACQAGHWTACTSAEYTAHASGYRPLGEVVCNGKDDDCDGGTDEDFSATLATGASVSGVGTVCGAGACAGGVTKCTGNGSGIECPAEALATPEVCGGGDEDCDGKADSADPSITRPPCENQQGLCLGALKPAALCSGGSWGVCTPATYSGLLPTFQPAVEAACDGIDEDCSGAADEDFELTLPNGTQVSGIATPCGAGVCDGGITQCNGTGDGLVCTSATVAGIEVCNGVDDDCDGQTDAADGTLALPLCENQAGVCGGAAKTAGLCQSGEWQACGDADYEKISGWQKDSEQRCDGLDNDCDGNADEDFSVTLPGGGVATGVGTVCGSGLCSGGKVQCASDELGAICTTAGAAGTEVCNGQDDDCDGLIDATDASLVTVPCEKQDGLCTGSKKAAAMCVGGGWNTCTTDTYLGWSGAYGATGELLCDGVDDDCDGNTDEDFQLALPNSSTVAGVGKACGSGACSGGLTRCLDSLDGIECPSVGAATLEVCNGEDDDCDGKIDAADESLLRPSCGNQQGICAGSVTPKALCLQGTWEECTDASYLAYDPRYRLTGETKCDGVDEDCSGAADEDFVYTSQSGTTVAGAGQPCGTGSCVGGETVCNPAGNGLVCTGDEGIGYEICDNKDNDCDGNIDEQPATELCANQNGVCLGTTKPAELCSDGSWGACGTNVYAEEPLYEGDSEASCDEQDNDCDGFTDEDFPVSNGNGTTVLGVGKPCGVGVCAGGFTVCDDPGSAKCSTAANATQEVCDGVDNDCDGLIDAADPSLFLAACEKTTGVCDGASKPVALCIDGSWDVCKTASYTAFTTLYQAGLETTCEGLDNDCDGLTDEDLTMTTLSGFLITGITKSCGVGQCSGGTTLCNTAQTGLQCSTEVNATATEIWYNGNDDACDGGSDYDQDGDGDKTPGHGGNDCNDLVGTVSSQATETRNGADDDCDTYCDETFIQSGTLLVTEIMPNPLGTGNEPYAEWFEVHNPSDTAFALCKGWTVSDNVASHTIATGVTVPARGYLKFGFSADTNANAGFTPDYTYGATPISSAIQLSNSADNVTLKFSDGTTTTTVDAVAYTSTFPFSDGFSIELSSALIAGPSATAASSNDSSSSWCKAAASPTYGTGGRGTPGAANTCP